MTSRICALAIVKVDFGGEGLTDAAAARKMILSAGATPGRDFTRRRQPRGRDALDLALAGYNASARFTPVLILRDLDDLPCPGEVVASRIRDRHPACLLRIAVRSLEAWLLADRDALAAHAKIRPARLPERPEELRRPKEALVAALRHSSNRTMRRNLHLDAEGPTWQMLGEWSSGFICDAWDPLRAAKTGAVPSLRRAMRRLALLAGG